MAEKYKGIRGVRSGNSKFPIESELNPIIFIWIEDGNIEVGYCKKGDDSAMKEMLSFIQVLEAKGVYYRIIGTWAGKYSTDVFKFLNKDFIEVLKEKIK